MHHKVVGNFGSEADVRSLYFRGFRFNETSDNGTCTHGQPAKLRPSYFENEPDFRPMHTKFERLLSKPLTTLEVMSYYLVVHTGPDVLCTELVLQIHSFNIADHEAKTQDLTAKLSQLSGHCRCARPVNGWTVANCAYP